MEEEDIRELEDKLKKLKIPRKENFKRLKRIYKLCITGLISAPKKRVGRWDEHCPICEQKLAVEIIYCFRHLSCSCGYEWTYASTSNDEETRIIKELKREVSVMVK